MDTYHACKKISGYLSRSEKECRPSARTDPSAGFGKKPKKYREVHHSMNFMHCLIILYHQILEKSIGRSETQTVLEKKSNRGRACEPANMRPISAADAFGWRFIAVKCAVRHLCYTHETTQVFQCFAALDGVIEQIWR